MLINELHRVIPVLLVTHVTAQLTSISLLSMSVSRNPSTVLRSDYPWTATPLIASAPMAKVSKPPLAVAVSKAGGLGFIAAGYTSHKLDDSLGEAAKLLSEESDALAIGESGTSLLG